MCHLGQAEQTGGIWRQNKRSLTDGGLVHVNRLHSNARYEGHDLQGQVEAHKKRQKVQRQQEYRERIPIEVKFGQGKNGYRLNNMLIRL